MSVLVNIINLLIPILHAIGHDIPLSDNDRSAIHVVNPVKARHEKSWDDRFGRSFDPEGRESSNGLFFAPTFVVGTSTICQNSMIYFVANDIDRINLEPYITRVTWDMGDLSPLIIRDRPANPGPTIGWMHTPVYIYATSGIKNVTMTLHYTLPGGSPTTFSITQPINVNPQPAPPVTANAKFCHMSTATPLAAQALSTHTLTWYEQNATGGWSLYNNSAPGASASPTPSTSQLGKVEYQVSQTSIHGCESNRASLWVETIIAPTAPPTVSDPVYCEGATALPLSITSAIPDNTNVVWYNTPTPSPTDLPLSAAPTPGTSASEVGISRFGVKLVSSIGCGESDMTTVTVKVNPKPAPPVVPGITACLNIPVNLPSNLPSPPADHSVLWWGTNATGGSPGTPSIPSTATAGTQTFYISYRNTLTTCQSDRTPVLFTVHSLPDADITGSNVVCQQTPVQLTLRASGGLPPSYQFRFEETGSAAGPITQTANASGEFVISNISTAAAGTKSFRLLSVTDGRCSQSFAGKTATILVKPNPTASMTINNPSVCEGATEPILSFTGTGGIGTYTFEYLVSNKAGNQSLSSGSNGTATLSVPTSNPNPSITFELISVSYRDVITCATSYTGITRTVTVHPLPTGSMSINGTTNTNLAVCQSSPEPALSFSASSGTAPYAFTYSRHFENGTPVNTTLDPLSTPSQNLPTTQPGTTRFTPISISDANGCSRTLTGTLALQVLPTPDATIKASASAVCMNGSVPAIQFTGSQGIAPYTFSYDVNGNNATAMSATGVNTASVSMPLTAAGDFEYTLRSVAYTQQGVTCWKDLSAATTVRVNPLPSATLTASAANLLICKDAPSPLLTFSGNGSIGPYTFEYTRNGLALNATGTTYVERVNTSIAEQIRYTLTGVTDANGCRQTASGNVDIEVAAIPEVNAGPNLWIMSGQQTVLKATASNANGLTYQWSPAIYVDDPAILQPIARPVSTTRFTITATSNKGCSNSASMQVTVLFQPEIPNTFTPNADGFNDRWEIRNLDSYPNALVEVYNPAGQLVYRNSGVYQPWDGTRNGSPLPAGTYYYVIHTRFGEEKRAGYITILR